MGVLKWEFAWCSLKMALIHHLCASCPVIFSLQECEYCSQVQIRIITWFWEGLRTEFQKQLVPRVRKVRSHFPGDKNCREFIEGCDFDPFQIFSFQLWCTYKYPFYRFSKSYHTVFKIWLKTLSMRQLQNLNLEVSRGYLKAALATVPTFLQSGLLISGLGTILSSKQEWAKIFLPPLWWFRNPHCKSGTLFPASHLRGGKSPNIKDIRPSQNFGHTILELTSHMSEWVKSYDISTVNKTYGFVVIGHHIRLRKWKYDIRVETLPMVSANKNCCFISQTCQWLQLSFSLLRKTLAINCDENVRRFK